MSDPMTFDELSELYRNEINNSALSSVRNDLYPAMAALCIRLEKECNQYADGSDPVK